MTTKKLPPFNAVQITAMSHGMTALADKGAAAHKRGLYEIAADNFDAAAELARMLRFRREADSYEMQADQARQTLAARVEG